MREMTGWLRIVVCLMLTASLVSPSLLLAQATDAEPEAAGEQATSMVGWLEISGPLRDGPVPFAWAAASEAEDSLQYVLRQLQTVRQNDRYLGVVIYLDEPMLSFTQIGAISDAIKSLRDEGKRVLVFSQAYDTPSYLLACSADMILLQHKGTVELTGLAIEEMYLAGLLEKVGVKADLLQVGQFKGADEQMTRSGPSDAWNENIDALLTDLYQQIVTAIADGRKMSDTEVEALIRDSWTMTDADYLRRRVVDRLTDRDLIDVTEIEFGTDFYWDDAFGKSQQPGQQVDSPFALFRMLFQKPAAQATRTSLAVIHANGAIHTGNSSVGDGMFSSDSIGSRTFVELLGDIETDDNIKGALIRIDSPGGSALASELIWQAVRQLGEQKPVFISVDSMAASGGYYIACAGDRIYVSPESILGSIGVVGGKLAMGGLYEKIGINVHRRSRGPLADMFNSVTPFTDEQRQVVLASMKRVYEQFTDRVRTGRGSRLQDVERVAAGRLFTGRQAVQNGLADELGGYDAAIAALATQVGLEKGQYDVVHFPRPMNLGEFLSSTFGVSSPHVNPQAHSMIAAARQVLGPRAWAAVSKTLSGLMLLPREPVLTLMPTAVVVR